MPLLRSHGAFLLLSAISAACASPPPAPRLPTPLEVEYADCKAVLVPGPLCVLGLRREIHLWVGAPPNAGIEIQVDGRRLDTAAKSIRDGQGFFLILPPGSKRVDVLVEEDEQAAWSLPLTDPESLPQRQGSFRDLLAGIRQKMRSVQKDIENHQLSTARETLHSLGLPPKAPAETRFFIAYYRALLAEAEGDYRRALEEIQRAAEIAERVKLEIYKRMAEEMLALFVRGVGRSRQAADLFERLRQPSKTWDPRADPCTEYRLLNNQAWSELLAREAGEKVGDPTPLLERALERYATCERPDSEDRANILIDLALAHLQEGRLAQAKDRLAQARSLVPDPPLPLTLWRLDLEARISLQEGRPAEALRKFDKLEELASAASSYDGKLRASFGKARSQVALADRTAALETLAQAETLLDEQSLQIPLQGGRETFMATRQAVVNLHVELLLDQGQILEALEAARRARSRVLRQLAHADRLASLPPDQRAHWTHLMAEYEERRAALEARAKDDSKLPTDQLRHEWATRSREAEKVKKILDQAFQVLADPARQPRETPPPPQPGELILAYHPLSRGWVGFATDGKTVMAHRFELPPEALSRPAVLGRVLLDPFRDSILKARRVRVLPSGCLQGVDFHELPFHGDVLLASVPVVYGLDLPVSASPARAHERRALLVADPRDDLPGALDETQKVLEVLESGPRPWIAEELQGEEASAETVRSKLAGADLLHYAGHGTFSGFGGWDSSLLLAEKTKLTLGDLLALKRVPASVVLSSCDTGRSSNETTVSGLGLAHAFLLAGSREVVASTRLADDREVPAFFADLYQRWDRKPDLAVALQGAQLDWRRRSPKADWRSFRLFVP